MLLKLIQYVIILRDHSELLLKAHTLRLLWLEPIVWLNVYDDLRFVFFNHWLTFLDWLCRPELTWLIDWEIKFIVDKLSSLRSLMSLLLNWGEFVSAFDWDAWNLLTHLHLLWFEFSWHSFGVFLCESAKHTIVLYRLGHLKTRWLYKDRIFIWMVFINIQLHRRLIFLMLPRFLNRCQKHVLLIAWVFTDHFWFATTRELLDRFLLRKRIMLSRHSSLFLSVGWIWCWLPGHRSFTSEEQTTILLVGWHFDLL